MFRRFATRLVEEALADTPVVFLMGARQVGKTTLVRTLIDDAWEYITFDDRAQLEIARADPVGFVRNLPPKRIALDEVQRVPDTLLAIKQAVDEDRTPGRFLLTGSANAILLPKLSGALVGRMEAVRLDALSECEVSGREPTFLDRMLRLEMPVASEVRLRDHLVSRIVTGGFPEPLSRATTSERRARAWHLQYVSTLIQRDLAELARVEHADAMTKLIELAALYSGRLVNLTELGGRLGLNRLTVGRYLALLEQLFLVERLPAWHTSEFKRLVKAPRLPALDPGMICALRGITRRNLLQRPADLGSLLESFVYNELRKQAPWAEEPLTLHHYRDKDQVEVDIIIETLSGRCFGIEVKAAAGLTAKDFHPLKRFRSVAGDRFGAGILLYDGDRSAAFGDRLFAVPVGALWAADDRFGS